MIEAAQNVRDAQRNEGTRGLKPARVETHESWIASVLERTLRSAVREKSQHRRRVDTESGQRWPDRETRAGAADRILEHDVEHRLLPHDLGLTRKGCPDRVCERAVVGDERALGWERHPRRHDARRWQLGVILVQL